MIVYNFHAFRSLAHDVFQLDLSAEMLLSSRRATGSLNSASFQLLAVFPINPVKRLAITAIPNCTGIVRLCQKVIKSGFLREHRLDQHERHI